MYVEHNILIVIKIKYETWIAKQFIATYEGWKFNSGNYLFTTDTK